MFKNLKIKIKIKNWVKFLNPPPKIGSLDITDLTIRYLIFDLAVGGGKPKKQASLRLPAGIIKNGQVKDKVKLTAALTTLHKQIGRFKTPLNVIVSISAANVYTQTFNLSLLAEGSVDEAARLNLQMISPIDIRSAYYDWQVIGEGDKRGDRMNFMGAFVISRVIDDLVESLDNARFIPVAIESSPMSLTRTISYLAPKGLSKPYLAFNLSNDGLDFFILKNGSLYFNQFISWATLQAKGGGAEVNIAVIKDVVTTEIRRIVNFYTSKWGGIIEDLVLMSVVANKELVADIKKNFKLDVHEVSLAKYPDLSVSWAVALGAALRGLVSRDKDNFISLSSVGTEEKFQQSRILSFMLFWRNITIASLVGLFLIYGIFDFSLARSLAGLKGKLAEAPVGLKKDEIEQLEQEAKEFNSLVDKTFLAKNQSVKWSTFFRIIKSLAGRNILLTQVQLRSDNLTVSVRGSANNERSVISFKNILIKEENFENISLPLTSIRIYPDCRASFAVTFKLKKWPL